MSITTILRNESGKQIISRRCVGGTGSKSGMDHRDDVESGRGQRGSAHSSNRINTNASASSENKVPRVTQRPPVRKIKRNIGSTKNSSLAALLLMLCVCTGITCYLFTTKLLQYQDIATSIESMQLQFQAIYSDQTSSSSDGLEPSDGNRKMFDDQNYKEYVKVHQQYDLCQEERAASVGEDDNTKKAEESITSAKSTSKCYEAASNFIELSLLWSLVGTSEGYLTQHQQMLILQEAERCLTNYLQLLFLDHTDVKVEEEYAFRDIVSDLYQTMGSIEMKRGATSEASEYFMKVLQNDPSHEKAQEFMTQMTKKDSIAKAVKTTKIDVGEEVEAMEKDIQETDEDGSSTQNQLPLPNLLMLGVYESGSKEVAGWLHRGGVCQAKTFGSEEGYLKLEPHFFDNLDGRYERGIEFYAKRFKYCVDEKKDFIMDATASNFHHAQLIYDTFSQDPRASDALANLKMIVILREPKSRLLASYGIMVEKMTKYKKAHKWYSKVANKRGGIKSFNEFTHDVLQKELESGEYAYHYVDHLKKLSQLFGRERILVLSYDELVERPETAQWRVETFLGAKFEGELYNDFEEENVPSSASQILDPLLEAKNMELYEFMESTRGPSMEMFPFPKFDSCTKTTPGFPYC